MKRDNNRISAMILIGAPLLAGVRVATSGCILACLFSCQLEGAMVRIVVSGRISVDDPLTLLPNEIQTGESWSGVIRYDTDLPDEDPDPQHGYFFDASRPNGISIAVNVHGHVFSGGFGELHVEVLNDIVHIPGQVFQPPPGDSFAIGGPMQYSPRLLDRSSIFFTWNNTSGNQLTSDRLPYSFDPFAFVQFDTSTSGGRIVFSPIYVVIEDFGLSTPRGVSHYSVIASIETANLFLVPEPRFELIYFVGSVLTLRRRHRLFESERRLAADVPGANDNVITQPCRQNGS